MANRYWVGGTGTWNTTSTTNWSATSGGATGASVPTAADSVFFDQAGTYTVTMTGALLTLDFTVSAGTVTFATGTTPTLAIKGSMSLIAGTIWNSTGTITFNATTTGKTITTNSVIINAPITFNGTGGGWSLGSLLTTGATNTTTLVAGTLTLNGFNLNTGIFASTGTATRAIAFGTNNIILSHTTAATTVLSFATATGFTYTGTGAFTADASITRTYVFGTTGGSTTISPNLSLTGSGTAIATFTTGSWFNTLNFGTTAFAVPVTVLNVNSLILSASGTFTSLGINAVGTGTLTPNGKTIAAFVVNNSTGTTTLAGALGCTTYTNTTGTFDCASFNLTCSSTATVTAGTLNNIGTLACTTFTANGGTTNHSTGAINPTTSWIVSNGTYTLSGTGTISSTLASYTINGTGTVTLNKDLTTLNTATFTLTAGNLVIGSGITLACGIFNTNNGNIRSITWSSTTSRIKLIHPTVNTTVLSAGNVTNCTIIGDGYFWIETCDVARVCIWGQAGVSTNFTNAVNLTLGSGSGVVSFAGNANTYKVMDFGTTSFASSPTGGMCCTQFPKFSATGTYTGFNLRLVPITDISGNTNGKSIGFMTFDATGVGGGTASTTATLTLTGAITCSSTLTHNQNNIDLSTFNLTCTTYSSTGTANRQIKGSGGSLTTTSSGTAFTLSGTGFVGTAPYTISMTSATAKTFSSDGKVLNCTLNQGGAGALTITGSNTFADITATTRPSTITFTAGTTQTVSAFTLAGTAGNLVTINSSIAGTQFTLTRPTGVTNTNYLSIQDSLATTSGTGSWYAGTTSTNVSNNSGWNFSSYNVVQAALFNFLFF